MTKTIGYLTMLGGAIVLVLGVSRIVHSDPWAAACVGLGVVFGAAGWYIAKKQPVLPGVH
jgi:hypothetical protein